MHRVVITGIGVVSPAGMTRDGFWSAITEARSAIAPLTAVPTERLNTRIAAQVSDFDPAAHFKEKEIGRLDRFAQFAVVAARAAVQDSNIEISEELALTTAVSIGN